LAPPYPSTRLVPKIDTSVASRCVSYRKGWLSEGRDWVPHNQHATGEPQMTKPRIMALILALGLILGLSACTNPYDPVQRMVGGGLIGAASGAAIGAAAAGGHGAALGAAIGGAVGAVGGLITRDATGPGIRARQYSY
jgi:hypothetical protein